MPTYDYRCDECAHQFEVFQSITDGPLKRCPACGKRKLKRLIGSGAALIFRGSGFYCTDYRKGGPSKGSGEGTESPSGGSGGSDGEGTASPKGSQKPDGSGDGAKEN